MTVNRFSIFSRCSCRISWVYYVGQPDEAFWQLIKQPKICLNALDISRLVYFLPLGALLGCPTGFIDLRLLFYLFLLALAANALGLTVYEFRGADLAHRGIVFSEDWQHYIGAPCNEIFTNTIETAIAAKNGQGFLIITHLREVYYLPRHCLLGESHVRLLEACVRHFTSPLN